MATSNVQSKNEFAMLQRVLRNQIGEMELALETVPREVYSNQLMEAMRREEVAMRDGQAISKEAAASIDNALNMETKKFFTKIAGQNVKRWSALQIKIQQEYERFNQRSRSGSRGGGSYRIDGNTSKGNGASLDQKGHGQPSLSAAEAESNGTSVSESVEDTNTIQAKLQWDQEILRLEQDYNSYWVNYEIPNLKAAFASQMERVDSDWNSHEASLTEEYNCKEKKISEKMGHNRIKESTSTVKRQYAANLESLQLQKDASKRWMKRQEIRLTAQAQEVGTERAKLGEILAHEIDKANSSH